MKVTDILGNIVAIVISIIAPAQDIYLLLGGMWFLNFMVGIWKSKYVDGIDPNWAKSKSALGEILVISLILFAISGICFFQKVPEAQQEYAYQAVGWIISYVFLRNIVRNGRKLNPRSTILRMLEWILNVEVISHFPIVKKALETKCVLDDLKTCDDCGACIIDKKLQK